MDTKLTTAHLKTLKMLEMSAKMMDGMKTEIASLKEEKEVMVKQLGDYYNCLDKNELDESFTEDTVPLCHADYIYFLTEKMKDYDGMKTEIAKCKEEVFVKNPVTGEYTDKRKTDVLTEKLGDYYNCLDKDELDGLAMFQGEYLEHSDYISYLKEKMFNFNIMEEQLEDKEGLVVENTRIRDENKELKEKLRLAIAPGLVTIIGAKKYSYVDTDSKLLIDENKKLQEEIAHKNEKFCEWIEENKELTEYNKMLLEEYRELYELLNCEDHDSAKSCIKKLQDLNKYKNAGIVSCQHDEIKKLQEENEKLKEQYKDLKQYDRLTQDTYMKLKEGMRSQKRSRIEFLEAKVEKLLTDQSYYECCGLEKVKEDDRRAMSGWMEEASKAD